MKLNFKTLCACCVLAYVGNATAMNTDILDKRKQTESENLRKLVDRSEITSDSDSESEITSDNDSESEITSDSDSESEITSDSDSDWPFSSCRTCDAEILDVIGGSGFSYVHEYDCFPNLKKLKIDAKNLGYFVAKLTDVFFNKVPVKMKEVSGWSTSIFIFDIFPALEEIYITERMRWSTIVRILRYFPTLKTITLSGLDTNEEQHDDAEIKYLDILIQETEKEQKNNEPRRTTCGWVFPQSKVYRLKFNIPQFLKYGITIDQGRDIIKNVVDIYKERLIYVDNDTNDTDNNARESDINGSIEKAKSLIDNVTKDILNLQDRYGKTALVYTIISDKIRKKDKTEMVKLLIKNGDIPNQEALFFARNLGYDEITNILDQNRPFSDCDEFKISNLGSEIMLQGNLKKIEYYDQEIFQHFGIDEDRVKKQNLFDYQKEMLELKDLNEIMSEVKDYTEMERYISKGDIQERILEKVISLLKKKLNSLSEEEFKAWLNETNYEGDTALHFAAKYDYEEIARLIMLGGANTDIKNKDGMTPSEYAEQYHSLKVANLLKNPSKTGPELLKNELMNMEEKEKKIREERDKGNLVATGTDQEIDSLLEKYPTFLNEKLNGTYPWEIAFANNKYVRVHALLTRYGATVKEDARGLSSFRKEAKEKLKESNDEERKMWEEIDKALNQQ